MIGQRQVAIMALVTNRFIVAETSGAKAPVPGSNLFGMTKAMPFPKLFLDSALVRAGNAHVFAVFGHRAAGHLNAL